MTKRKVLRVDSVELTRIPGEPSKVKISAFGTASTSGWTAPQLVPFVYIQAPPDGIYDFILVALRPSSGGTLPVLTPLPEPASITEIEPDGFNGVRIHALENQLQKVLAPASGVVALQAIDSTAELVTHLKAVAEIIAKSEEKMPSKARDCRQVCRDIYDRELEQCKDDVSCITKATGRYVVCLRRCQSQV